MTGPRREAEVSARATGWESMDTAVALGLAVLTGIVYVLTLAPSVIAGNSGEYQYAVPILGIVHSTGYPLYTLIGKWFSLLPVGDVAYRMNLFSAVAASGAVALAYVMLRRLTPLRALAAATALALGLARSFWGAALIAEVHTLNVLFVALDVWLVLRWAGRQRGRDGEGGIAWPELRVFALVYGLSLTHHRTVILLLPAFAVFILWTAWPALKRAVTQRGRFARGLLLTALIGLVPLALYAYIPLRGAQWLATSDPAVTGLYRDRVPEAVLRGTVTAHYAGGLSGFMNLVSGRDYSGDVGIESLEQLGERLNVWGTTLVEQFSAVGLLLALIGVVVLFRRDRRLGALFGLGYLCLALFAAVYVGHGQIWYYFMPSYVFVAGFMVVALDATWRLLENRPNGAAEPDPPSTRRVSPYALFAVLTFLLPAAMAQGNWTAVDLSGHRIDSERAQDVLSRPVEQGAVVMGPWDLATPVRYYQFVEGLRPDLVMIHGDASQGSGRRIMKRAIELARPFYVLEPTRLSPRLAELLGHWAELTPVTYYGPVPSAGRSADFGDQIALLGVEVEPEQVAVDRQAGGALSVGLYWRALADLKTDYKLFAHLIAPDGTTRARIDETAGSVYYPPSQWQPGQTFRDERWLVLGPDAPAGLYRLEVGLYDPDSGERLPIAGGGDTLSAGQITVTERSGT